MLKLQDIAKTLGKAFAKKQTIELRVKRGDSLDKLWWLEDNDRDFLKVTQANAAEMMQAFVSEYVKHEIISEPQQAVMKASIAAGLKYKEIVVARFGFGKKDIAMRPLTQDYIKKKGNSRIGYNTGKLYNDLKNAAVVVGGKQE